MFTDDGQYLDILGKLLNDLRADQFQIFIGNLINQSQERFIPAANLTYMIRLWVSGLKPQNHYMFQLILAILSIISLFCIVKLITNSATSSLISVLTFILFSTNWENYYRLYPIESLTTLTLSIFAATFAILIEKGQNIRLRYVILIIGIGALAYALYAKETVIIMIMPLTFAAIWHWKRQGSLTDFTKEIKSNTFLFFISFLILIVIWILLKSTFGVSTIKLEGYAANYRLSFSAIAISIGKYIDIFWNNGGPLFFIVFGMGMAVICSNYKKDSSNKILFWAGFFFIWGTSFIVILLPWRFAIGRYLMPAVWAYAVVFGICWDIIFKKFKESGTVLAYAGKFTLIILLIFYLFVNVVRINHMQAWMKVRDSTNDQLLDYLASVPQPEKRRLWFVYPEPVETYSHVNPLLDHTRGRKYEQVDRLDRLYYKNQWRQGDLVIFPDSEGDGHFSCDGIYDRTYKEQFEIEVTPFCILSKQVKNQKMSNTIYLDSLIFNYIKKSGWSIPESVISQRTTRNIWDSQLLIKSWTIYEVR